MCHNRAIDRIIEEAADATEGEKVLADVKTLLELQQVDQSIGELTSKIEALPRQIKTFQDQLQEFLSHLDERKARQAVNQKERRNLDAEVQSI
ncbi:MAG: hypothetical protein ACRD1O_08270, partial [Terriglobia bacterium]